MLNLPNMITLLRVLLIPVLVVLMATDGQYNHLWGAIVFIIITVSDWLDGYLARRMNLTSRLGAFLDPVADKLCVGVVVVMLVWKDPRLIIAIPAAIIIGREIFVSGLREWMADLGLRDAVAVDKTGKLKTTAQDIAIILLIFKEDLLGLPIYTIGVAGFWLATALAILSMLNYLKGAWPHMRESD